ncbi:protein of unknown function [Thiomonas sp. CB2]|nr:protein of unknown function [Thiomonas sp. CB2]
MKASSAVIAFCGSLISISGEKMKWVLSFGASSWQRHAGMEVGSLRALVLRSVAEDAAKSYGSALL